MRDVPARFWNNFASPPTRVRFVFTRSLDDPHYLWLNYQESELQRVTMPPLGGSVTLHPDGGLVGLLRK